MLSKRLFRTIIVATIAILAIYYSRVILMPIIFSGLVAMLVHPLVKKFESIGMNLVFASLSAVLLITIVFGGIFTLITIEGVDIVQNLPLSNVDEAVQQPIEEVNQESQNLGVEFPLADMPELIERTKSVLMDVLPTIISEINSAVSFLLTVPIYIFFMLISRSPIRKFYYSSFEKSHRKLANRILSQIETVYMNYLKGMFYVVLIVGSLTTIGLYAIGIQHALFIGALSGLLTLVPYIGVIVGALIPVIIALITKDSYWYAAGVVMIYAAVQFLEGNIITPKIMGDQVGVNPLMVILGIVLFGAIGGILGMVLTIPVLALLKVISGYIPGWQPLKNLLDV